MSILTGIEAERALRAKGIPIPKYGWGHKCLGHKRCKNMPTRRMVAWKQVDDETLRLRYCPIPYLLDLCAECHEIWRWN